MVLTPSSQKEIALALLKILSKTRKKSSKDLLMELHTKQLINSKIGLTSHVVASILDKTKTIKYTKHYSGRKLYYIS